MTYETQTTKEDTMSHGTIYEVVSESGEHLGLVWREGRTWIAIHQGPAAEAYCCRVWQRATRSTHTTCAAAVAAAANL
jgi:NADH:ubiquinone oxidoreductase subunit